MTNANVPFSGLPIATSITGAEIIPADQGGTTKQITAAQIAALSNGSPLAAPYVLVSSSPLAPNGRTLAVGASLTVADGGAGSTITLGTVAITGDVTSSANSFATTVVKINGVPLGTTTATSANVLIADGAQWVSRSISGDISITSSGVVSVNALHSGAFANPTASVGLSAVNGSATTAMRSDGAPALSQAIAPTWTGVHIHSPTSGVAITLNSPANTNTAALNIVQSGPTSGTSAGPINLNLITISSYNASVTGTKFTDFGEWSSALTGFRVNFTGGGANIGATEPLIGILGHVRMTTATTTSVTTDFEGMAGISYISAASSGSGTTHEGVVGATVADAGANVLFTAGVFAEADIINGGVVAARAGVSIDSEGTGRATGDDSMIALSAINNTGNYKIGILVSTKGGGQPIMSTGDFMASVGASSGAFTLGNFINLPNMTVTTNVLALQNTTLTGAGALHLQTGTLTPAAGVKLTVNKNTVAAPLIFSANSVTAQFISADAALNRVVIHGPANIPILNFVQSKGTLASPTASQINDFLGAFGAFGYGATGYGTGGGASIIFQATQNWTDTAQGTNVQFSTTPNGTAATVAALTIQNSGGVSVGTNADPGINNLQATDIFTNNATNLIRTKTTLTNSSSASTATLTNSPVIGNPTKWFAIDDNGTSRKIPAW